MGMIMRFPEGKAKAFTLSYDDGMFQDIRLVEILNHNGLKGTFNLISGRIRKEDAVKAFSHLSADQIRSLYLPNGHEVAIHTHTHRSLTDLSKDEIAQEYLQCKSILEDVLGTDLRGSAYPNSRYNQKVLSVLRDIGIAYARGGDQTGSFALPSDWLQFMPTARHNDANLFDLGEQFLQLAIPPHQECALFCLMGHSYEFDQNSNWETIESFAQKMGGHADIWYATNLEIYDYIQAYRTLDFDPTGAVVQNPTDTDLWFVKDGKESCVPAGKTIRLDG